jgi:hypothetical protein
MDALETVPWQHWLALAAAGWTLALMCFVGFYTPRRRDKPEQQPSTSMPAPRPDVVLLLRDYERTYRRQRAA